MSYVFEGHAFKADRPVARLLGRAVCVNCGLLRLKNLLTDWAVQRGCNFQEHPGFAAAQRELPARHREAA